jgi:hypothetical protein
MRHGYQLGTISFMGDSAGLTRFEVLFSDS